MCINPVGMPPIQRRSFNRPGDGFPEGVAQHGAAGFADGRQRLGSPCPRTALAQLGHEQTMHQQHEVHVPRLALAAAQLTVTQAQMLLAVPMQGLRPCPAVPVATQHPRHFPVRLIGNQNLDRRFAIPMLLENHDPYGMRVVRQPNLFGEVPRRALSDRHLLAIPARNLRRHLLGP
jgi:hypothetical protein